MNISHKLLIAGLLVGGIAQAATILPEVKKAILDNANRKTQEEKAAAEAGCNGDAKCLLQAMKIAVRSVKEELKNSSKEAKAAYLEQKGTYKDKKKMGITPLAKANLKTQYKVSLVDYETKKEAYHAYRGSLDKIWG